MNSTDDCHISEILRGYLWLFWSPSSYPGPQKLDVLLSACSISHIHQSSSEFSILFGLQLLTHVLPKYDSSGHLIPQSLAMSSLLQMRFQCRVHLSSNLTTVQ